MTVAAGLREALNILEGIGKWENVEEQQCTDGTPLGHAYDQGWNACFDELYGRIGARLKLQPSGKKAECKCKTDAWKAKACARTGA